MKSLIIQDNWGNELKLTTKRLQQITGAGFFDYGVHWFVKAADIRRAYSTGLDKVLICCVEKPNVTMNVRFFVHTCRIGCSSFSTKTFNKILRTLGVKLSKKLKVSRV